MKQINTYINEKLRLTSKQKYTCQPKSKGKLQNIIKARIKDEGNECDLNDIDVSQITDMSHVFDAGDNYIFEDFNGDLSMWDVSNVTNMQYMFWGCKQFNCDISQWNVSNVTNMTSVFTRCEHFNRDLSSWDTSNVKRMTWMFSGCKKFNQDLNSWNVSNVEDGFMLNTFHNCPTKPDWYDKDKYESMR